MKKIVALLLVLSMMFALFGCGAQSDEKAELTNEPAEAPDSPASE